MRVQRHIELMDVPEADDRRRAIRVLGEIGSPAKRALRRLMHAFKDPHEEVRGAAAEAVFNMGDLALPYLLKALNDPHPSLRGRSANLLGGFAPHFTDAIPKLIRLLEDPHVGVRRTAAVSLEEFGPLAKDATSSLCRLLGDSDRDMRRHAAQTLGKIKTVSDDAVISLASALDGEGDEEARRSIVYAMGDIGSTFALNALARALSDPSRHVAALAAEAIGRIGSANDACLSSLITVLGESDYTLLQVNAARTLGIIKSSRPDVIAALRHIAGTANSSCAFCATWALGEIGPEAASAIPELRKLKNESPEETIRGIAAEALKKIDPMSES
jgi:HEAT repeat protein